MRSLLLLLACLGLTACGSSSGSQDSNDGPPPGPLESAYESCLDADEEGGSFGQSASLSSDGESIIVDSTASETAGLLSAVCILARSDAPDTIAANMGSTTAMMGRQQDSYDGIEVQWSYSGMEGGGGFQATFAEEGE